MAGSGRSAGRAAAPWQARSEPAGGPLDPRVAWLRMPKPQARTRTAPTCIPIQRSCDP